MSGMKTPISAGVSDYNSRLVTIQVTGVCRQSVLKTSNYQVRVPYSQMAQALRNINNQGGKVASVQLMGNEPVMANVDASSAKGDAHNAKEEKSPEKKAPVQKKSKRKRR